jgi:hypothetical protein
MTTPDIADLLHEPYPHPAVPVYDRTRDEFAMTALTGLLSGRAFWYTDASNYAKAAYIIADAMLAERNIMTPDELPADAKPEPPLKEKTNE